VGQLLVGDVAEARRTLAEAHVLATASDSFMAAWYAQNLLADADVLQGRLRHAAQVSREVLESIGDRPVWHAGLAHARLGMLYREWNEVDTALKHLRLAVSLGERIGQQPYMAPVYINLARALHAAGEAGTALEALDQAERSAGRMGNSINARRARAFQARLWLAQGEVARADAWRAQSGIADGDPLTFAHEVEYLTLARLLIARGCAADDRASLDTAGTLLGRLLRDAEAQERVGSVIEILALSALAADAVGDTERARDALLRALRLAEPEGYVRLFVDEGEPMERLLAAIGQRQRDARTPQHDYIARLITAFPHQGNPAGPPPPPPIEQHLVEPLTQRELEVLQLVAAGLPNQEIAERLSVTTGTVKTHLKSIYGKLDAHSRTQALARARDLALL
jgi:LuxR family maltose regulon positive regulatory protein